MRKVARRKFIIGTALLAATGVVHGGIPPSNALRNREHLLMCGSMLAAYHTLVYQALHEGVPLEAIPWLNPADGASMDGLDLDALLEWLLARHTHSKD